MSIVESSSPVAAQPVQTPVLSREDQASFRYDYGPKALPLINKALRDKDLTSLSAFASVLQQGLEARFLSSTKIPLFGARVFGWTWNMSDLSQFDNMYLTPQDVCSSDWDPKALYVLLTKPDSKIKTADFFVRTMQVQRKLLQNILVVLESRLKGKSGEGYSAFEGLMSFRPERLRYRQAFNTLVYLRLAALKAQRPHVSYRGLYAVCLAKYTVYIENLTQEEKGLFYLFSDAIERGEALTIRKIHNLTGFSYASIKAGLDVLVFRHLLIRPKNSYASIQRTMAFPNPENARQYVEEHFEKSFTFGADCEAQSILLTAVLLHLGADTEAVAIRQGDLMLPMFRGLYQEASGGLLEIPMQAMEVAGVLVVDRTVRPFTYRLVEEDLDVSVLFEDVTEGAKALLHRVLLREGSVSFPQPTWYAAYHEQHLVSLLGEETSSTERSPDVDVAALETVETPLGGKSVTPYFKPAPPIHRIPREGLRVGLPGGPVSSSAPEVLPHSIVRTPKPPSSKVAVTVDIEAPFVGLVTDVTKNGEFQYTYAADGTHTVTFTWKP